MTGRYGTDEYAKFLLTVTLVLCILTLFIRNWVMYLLTALAFAWSYYRILSKDFERRREENERFRALESRFGRWCRVQKRKFDGRREYRFFKCPNCGQQVRVPRDKGRIRITCPKCHTQFDRTT